MSIYDDAPKAEKGTRWFLRHGAKTKYTHGWKTKADASDWINSQSLEWRAGFVFRRHDDPHSSEIVSRNGKLPAV